MRGELPENRVIRSTPMLRLIFAWSLLVCFSMAQDAPASLPQLPWHLTASAWQPTGVTTETMLDALERGVVAIAKLQDERGAIIDPLKHREFQYATPYFACALGVLVKHGRARHLLPIGIRAMEHATTSFGGGIASIPDRHGEFYIAALAEALETYRTLVPGAQWQVWKRRLETPLSQVIEGFGEHQNNWRTYAMRGEWLRAQAGLVPKQAAVDFIERSWRETQEARMRESRWNLYLDYSSDPNSQAVEAVGRGNLLGILAAGYDGPSAGEMRSLIERATRTTLLLQDPTGQAPPNGRTDDHVWNDILYQLCFEMAAEMAHERGDAALASQYRRAASLAFQSAVRWQREDGAFQVTKNFFPNEMRVGYQPASQWSNYNAAVLIHLAEAIETRQSPIEEAPMPAEIGGYSFATDEKFASAFANAGGMQMLANLRGVVDPAKYNVYWTPLGVARFSRARWNSLLGPPDGVRDSHSREGVSFGPAWLEGAQWVDLAVVPERYVCRFETDFANPALVRCRIRYSPREGAKGPSFAMRFTLVPSGILAEIEAERSSDFGFSIPLLEGDGREGWKWGVDGGVAHTKSPDSGDEQVFLALGDAAGFHEQGDRVQSPVGWLRPMRTRAKAVFIYPRSGGDGAAPAEPLPARVLSSFALTENGFRSEIGRVEGNLFVGPGVAGGRARSVQIKPDAAKPEIVFSNEVDFVARHRNGVVTMLEVSLPVTATVNGTSVSLRAYEPFHVP